MFGKFTRSEARGSAHRAGRMPRFERRVLLGGLLVSLPAWAGLVWLLAVPTLTPGWWAPAVAMAGVLTLLLARWLRQRVAYPLHTLAGLLEALRQGDYSLRGASSSALGEVMFDVNALAQRLQAERLDFEESSYLLAKTLRSLDSAVFVFDAAAGLRLANPAAQRLLGAEAAQLFGRSAADLGLAAWLAAPPAQPVAHAFPGRSGRFDVRCTALRSSGRGGQLLVLSDVGPVLRAEERQAWQRLLRVLGHEVNNSLAPIQSMAGTLGSLLARDPPPPEWREDASAGLAVIEKRAAALARFLAGYSRLAKLPPPTLQAVDLGPLVAKVAHLETRVAVRVQDGPALRVQADPDQLEQALINLVTNAADAVAGPAGTVRVRWQAQGPRAVIEVIDDGPGPPPSGNLFVPFFTTKPGGSGIGLALVRQIAEAHGGGVSLGAREGGCGCVARLWLG